MFDSCGASELCRAQLFHIAMFNRAQSPLQCTLYIITLILGPNVLFYFVVQKEYIFTTSNKCCSIYVCMCVYGQISNQLFLQIIIIINWIDFCLLVSMMQNKLMVFSVQVNQRIEQKRNHHHHCTCISCHMDTKLTHTHHIDGNCITKSSRLSVVRLNKHRTQRWRRKYCEYLGRMNERKRENERVGVRAREKTFAIVWYHNNNNSNSRFLFFERQNGSAYFRSSMTSIYAYINTYYVYIRMKMCSSLSSWSAKLFRHPP